MSLEFWGPRAGSPPPCLDLVWQSHQVSYSGVLVHRADWGLVLSFWACQWWSHFFPCWVAPGLGAAIFLSSLSPSDVMLEGVSLFTHYIS